MSNITAKDAYYKSKTYVTGNEGQYSAVTNNRQWTSSQTCEWFAFPIFKACKRILILCFIFIFVKEQLANETLRIRDAKIKVGEGRDTFWKKNIKIFFPSS